MTETQILIWIRDNLGLTIRRALADSHPVIYTEDWLAAMCMRETGLLINKLKKKGIEDDDMSVAMRGDYSQRKGEVSKRFHGFGYWQIDIDSFPDFVKSEDWKDPYKCCMKAISVLEGKRRWLAKNNVFDERAITAAYNCGEGNVWKAIKKSIDVDSYTHQKNYSSEVWRYRDIYKSLPEDI